MFGRRRSVKGLRVFEGVLKGALSGENTPLSPVMGGWRQVEAELWKGSNGEVRLSGGQPE